MGGGQPGSGGALPAGSASKGCSAARFEARQVPCTQAPSRHLRLYRESRTLASMVRSGARGACFSFSDQGFHYAKQGEVGENRGSLLRRPAQLRISSLRSASSCHIDGQNGTETARIRASNGMPLSVTSHLCLCSAGLLLRALGAVCSVQFHVIANETCMPEQFSGDVTHAVSFERESFTSGLLHVSA